MKRIVPLLLLAGCQPLIRQGRTDICAKDGNETVLWQDVEVSDPDCYIVPFPEHIAQPPSGGNKTLTLMIRCKHPVKECHDCAH